MDLDPETAEGMLLIHPYQSTDQENVRLNVCSMWRRSIVVKYHSLKTFKETFCINSGKLSVKNLKYRSPESRLERIKGPTKQPLMSPHHTLTERGS